MIKGSIQEDKTIIYAPNIGAPQYIRQMLTRTQLDLTDIYRTFHPKTINFTFFSSAHRTFFRITSWAHTGSVAAAGKLLVAAWGI